MLRECAKKKDIRRSAALLSSTVGAELLAAALLAHPLLPPVFAETRTYIVMAYIVMACVVMAHAVMAHAVMAILFSLQSSQKLVPT